MSNKLEIRHATASDIPEGVELSKQFYALHDHLTFDEQAAINLAHVLMNKGALLVIREQGKLVGMIGGLLVPNAFDNSRLVFQVMIWEVDENHPNGRIGIKLLKHLEKMVEEMGLDALIVTPTLKTPKLFHILERMGFNELERTYAKEFDNGN